MAEKLYKVQMRGYLKSYLRYFQKLITNGGEAGSPHYAWHTSRDHDRGFYIAPDTAWVLEEHEDYITVTDKASGEAMVGYPYDHAEELRLAAAGPKVIAATGLMAPEPSDYEFVVEVSANGVWLSGPGAMIRISEIAMAISGKEVGKPDAEEKTLIILKNGGQASLDLPLEVVYRLLGELIPAKG